MEMQIVINNLGIPIWPLGILILFGVLAILLRRKHSFPYLAFFSIFWVYVMVGLDKTLFPLQINGTFVDVMRQAPLFSQVNLVPFYFSKYGLSAAGYYVILANILLTIPFGFGLNFIRRLRLKDILWLSFAVGFGIEVCTVVNDFDIKLSLPGCGYQRCLAECPGSLDWLRALQNLYLAVFIGNAPSTRL